MERSEILRLNEYLRLTDGVRKTDGLRKAADIPVDDYFRIVRLNPALASRDPVEQKAAWDKYLQSPESLPYRVREKI